MFFSSLNPYTRSPETVDEPPEFSGSTQPVLSGTGGVHLTQGSALAFMAENLEGNSCQTRAWKVRKPSEDVRCIFSRILLDDPAS